MKIGSLTLGLNSGLGLGPMIAPTSLAASFSVSTIAGTLTWTDNMGGKAAYEVESNTGGAGYVLLTTTADGATSYSDTACKQNASVVYRIRAKRGTKYSDYVTAGAVLTPLVFKTNQSTLNTLTINNLNISAGKTINIDWGNSSNNNYTGNNATITKTYAATGIYNVAISGDINSIVLWYMFGQPNIHGNITNWVVPSTINAMRLYANAFTGDRGNAIVPASCVDLRMRDNQLTGKSPNIAASGAGALFYQYSGNPIIGTNLTNFKRGATSYDFSNCYLTTGAIDTFFLNVANYSQANAPTASCSYNFSGANNGIPTGGSGNLDIARLAQYYVNAGFTATILIRTS